MGYQSAVSLLLHVVQGNAGPEDYDNPRRYPYRKWTAPSAPWLLLWLHRPGMTNQINGTTARDRRDDPTSARHASPSNRQSSLPSPRSTDIGGGTAVEDRPHPPGPPASASRGRMDTSEPAPQSGYLDFLDAPEYLTASLDFAEKETARKSVTSMETTTLNSIETTVTAVEDLNGHDTYPTHLYSWWMRSVGYVDMRIDNHSH